MRPIVLSLKITSDKRNTAVFILQYQPINHARAKYYTKDATVYKATIKCVNLSGSHLGGFQLILRQEKCNSAYTVHVN